MHGKKPIKIKHLILILGIIGLAQQILAGRILTPEFGNSVYTWGSIIGVFMLFLSLGYHFGGKYAHKSSNKSLSIITGMVSVNCIVLGLFGSVVASWIGLLPLPPQYGVLPAVILLFGLSTFLIGMATPLAIQLIEEKQKGKAAGDIFTIDTIGSIIGSFGATFVLIPLLSVSHSFFFLAAIGCLAIIITAKHKVKLTTFFVIILLALILIPTFQTKGDGVYYKTDSLYQKVEVFDKDGVRFLYLDNHPQSGMFLHDLTEDAFPYSRYFDVPFLFTNVTDILFIGGGGFTGPRDFVSQGIDVTVVELDQEVVNVAIDYFYINEDEMDIVVSDGREYLRNTDKKFDVIILDAFRKDRIPFHLATQEFYKLVYDSLKSNGVMYTNIIGFPKGVNSDFFRTSLKTIQTTFPSTYAFQVIPEASYGLQNIQIIGTKSYETLSPEELYALDQSNDLVDVERLIPSLYENVPVDDVIVLTDAYAPVEELIRVE